MEGIKTKEDLIQLAKQLDLCSSYNWDISFIRHILGEKFNVFFNDIKNLIHDLINENILLLDSNKLKEEFISSKTQINDIKFSDSIGDMERNKYNINWYSMDLVEYPIGATENDKKEIAKYRDDYMGQKFIYFLLMKYSALKEEDN